MIGTFAALMLMQGAAAAVPAEPGPESGPDSGQHSSSPEASAAAIIDYALPQNWLCRPGRRDVCSAPDYETTVLAADGAAAVQPYERAASPAIDCFYVYPTVSLDQGLNSDLVVNEEERYVVAGQFARFGSVCRQFAPLYRQFTIPALRARIAGKPLPGDQEAARETAYRDVRAAFRHYMQNDNQGRPYLIYGHSQGTSMLKRLLAEEIEGKPAAKTMLSAILLGINVGVEPGKMTGEFQTPLCTEAGDTGCIVSWVSFRADDPPGEASNFARWRGDEGYAVACTNPADLAGNSRAALGAAIPTSRNPELPVDTPYLSVPGLLTGQCADEGGAQYFSVDFDHEAPSAALAEQLMIAAQSTPGWGLHMIDANVAQDDLIAFVAGQAAAAQAGGNQR